MPNAAAVVMGSNGQEFGPLAAGVRKPLSNNSTAYSPLQNPDRRRPGLPSSQPWSIRAPFGPRTQGCVPVPRSRGSVGTYESR
jgi:hypothetical protein